VREKMLGRLATRVAHRKIGWYCCPGHDGWIDHRKNRKRLKRLARRAVYNDGLTW